MTYQTRWIARLLGAALLLLTQVSIAGGSADNYVRDRQGELVALLTQPKSASREEKISAIMDQTFDYYELAKRSLGDEWQSRSDADKQEFRHLLEGLVKQSYRRHLGKTLGWEVAIKAPSNVPDGVRVPTIATHQTDKRKEPVEVDYLLHEVNGQWKVFDIVIEGSSLVGNYNSQFRKIIHKQGFNELIARMKRRLEKGKD
jgi:phospholipid transport system substrate-binding protein